MDEISSTEYQKVLVKQLVRILKRVDINCLIALQNAFHQHAQVLDADSITDGEPLPLPLIWKLVDKGLEAAINFCISERKECARERLLKTVKIEKYYKQTLFKLSMGGLIILSIVLIIINYNTLLLGIGLSIVMDIVWVCFLAWVLKEMELKEWYFLHQSEYIESLYNVESRLKEYYLLLKSQFENDASKVDPEQINGCNLLISQLRSNAKEHQIYIKYFRGTNDFD